MEPEVFAIHDRLKAFPPAQMLYITYRRLVEQGLATTWLWVADKLWRTVYGVAPAPLSEIRPGLFVGGQHRRRGLKRMRAMGISAVVNLREESDDAARGVAMDAYLWLPTTDDTPPSLDDMERGVVFIEEQMRAGRGVYIHCASGVGRAPTLAAAYLVTCGLSPSEAWSEILHTRPFVRPTPTQTAVIEAFAEHWTQSIAASPSLQQRLELAIAPLREDAALTAGLTDEVARALLSWAEGKVIQWVRETATSDDEAAATMLAPKLQRLHHEVRQIAREVEGTPDPMAALAQALAADDLTKA